MKRLPFLLLPVFLLLLVACGGTLEVDLAPTGADDPLPQTISGTPAARIPLTSYTDADRGFTLPVPHDALVEEVADEAGYLVGFHNVERGFSLLVSALPDLPGDSREPAAVLSEVFAADILPANLTSIAGASAQAGGWLALPAQPGEACAEVIPVGAAFVSAGRAFSLLISSDTPGRCNAALLPETKAILEGFQVESARIAIMTPTPVPPPPLQIAYLREENVWLWTEGEGCFTLFEEGGASGPIRLHPKGRWVAFLRDGQLWVVSRDGNDERALTDDSTFADHRLPAGTATALGFQPYRFTWLPGTDLLLFNTRALLDGPGLLLGDDLWQVDVTTGAVTNLLASGEGGNFTLSPDGRQLALARPDAIELAAVDGSQRQQLLSYEPVLTYSEYRFYPQPVWAPDGTALRVAIPPADPLANPGQGTAIWHLSADDAPARRLGEIPTPPVPPGANIALAPTLDTVAFLRPALEEGVFDLYLASLAQNVGEPVLYAEGVEAVHRWSQAGDAFAFTPLSDGTPRLLLGRPGARPEPIGDPGSATLAPQWAGPSGQDLVYLQQAGDGWEIWLDRRQGEDQMIDAIPGTLPAFATRHGQGDS